MPDVSTITARLRAGAWVAGRLNPKAAAVTLDVAESAVEEAYRAGEEARGPAASPDERLREALAWIAEYGERNGDLRTGHLQAVKHIARNALGLEPGLPLAAADRETPDEEA